MLTIVDQVLTIDSNLLDLVYSIRSRVRVCPVLTAIFDIERICDFSRITPPEGENSVKWQKTFEYDAHVIGESSGQVNESEQNPLSSGNQEQVNDYDFWTESYAPDDDEIPMKQVSQDIMEEVSLTINEAELKKIADEIKEILASPHPRKTTPLVQSCQIDPEALAVSPINQDLLYLKEGNSRLEKIVLSLHKFLAIIFNDVDFEERTSRFVNKCVNKFNPYARYGVED
ncbi:hypothetical protein Tco_0687350 [Tanacetum coccineum]